MNKTEIKQYLKQLHPEDESWTNQLFARIYSDMFRDCLRFNRTVGEWFYYTGKVWAMDQCGLMAERAAKRFYEYIFQYSWNVPEKDEKRLKFQKRLAEYGKYHSRTALIKDARECCFIDESEFDSNPDLYNLQNGTFDLQTFQLKPHNPTDLLSKISSVWYDPNANSEQFSRFIDQIMNGNVENARFLQTVKGYALSGRAEEECAIIENGKTTRNGKGTLNLVMLRMHGDYGIASQPEILQQKKKDSRQASGDVARLNKARYVNISEPDKRMRIDAGLLKQLTGRDPITARFLHQKDFSFDPTFTIFMNTNHLPYIDDPTLFDSDRIVVIPFERHFSAEERDTHLKEKLTQKENVSVAFNWCIEGLKRYRAEGLKIPESVKNATNEYRQNADEVGHFIADRMERAGVNTTGKDAYEAYQNWCAENFFTPTGKKDFFSKLKDRGMMKETATVDGRTMFNVIVGYQIIQ